MIASKDLKTFIKGLLMRAMPSLTTCEELEGFIADYVEGTLPENQKRELEKHLKGCSVCVDYIQEYRNTIEISQLPFKEENNEVCEIPDELTRAILAARSKQS